MEERVPRWLWLLFWLLCVPVFAAITIGTVVLLYWAATGHTLSG